MARSPLSARPRSLGIDRAELRATAAFRRSILVATMDTMLQSVITMGQANEAGFSRRKVYRLVRQGLWQQLHQCIYLTRPDLVDEARWKAELAALLLRCGDGAFVSHGAAAALHRFDGVTDRPVVVTVVSNTNRFPKTVHRTRFAEPNAVEIEGLTTASPARTLRDLAADHPIEVVEQAVESALRGSDPRRPDVWNTSLLADLRSMVSEQPRLAGAHRLRQALGRRTDLDRPTGSFPETVLLQALRAVGVHCVPQATLRIVDVNGVRLDTFFPDLAVPQHRLLIEVDGAAAHANETALSRDLRRQNKVLRGFRLLRFTAVDVLRDPTAVASQVERVIRDGGAASANSWTADGVSVEYSADGFLVVDRSRSARGEAAIRRAVGRR